MTRLKLPTPPEGVAKMRTDHAQPVLIDWLWKVARDCGEPALDHALSRPKGGGWPGTDEQRTAVEGHVETIRNECRQLAHETYHKDRIAAGSWGV